jgi:hypothetical protein
MVTVIYVSGMYAARRAHICNRRDCPLVTTGRSMQVLLASICEISSSHGGEYDVQSCLLGQKTTLNSFNLFIFKFGSDGDNSVTGYKSGRMFIGR